MRLIDSHCHLNADRFERDADLVVGAARLAGVERILVPGWNVASSRARARAASTGSPGSTPRSASTRTTPRKVDDAGWARIVALGRGPAGRGDRRDRPRLRPRLQPDRRTSSPTCGGTSALALETGQAGDPPLPLRPRAGATPRTRWSRSCARPGSAGPPGPRPSGSGRRRSSTRSPGRLDYARDGDRPRSRGQLLGPRVPGGARRRRPRSAAIVPADRLLIETDSPFLAPPGAPRSRNEPEWVRVTGAWARRTAGHDPGCDGARPRRRVRPDIPESPEDTMTPATRRLAPR